MKESVIHTLLMAKAIYNEAKPLVYSGNKHSCSAGLILLQDSIELIVLAMLNEKGVDETKALQSKSFDGLLDELKKSGITISKLVNIKALNKQRVLVKHYGQLADPAAVRNYAEAADTLIQSVLPQVTGKTLQDIFLSDLVPDCEAKIYLQNAIKLSEQGKYLEGLIEIRKAFFVEYEIEYAIHQWASVDKNKRLSIPDYLFRQGLEAPYRTRNKEWIDEHVKSPTDYIQIDYEKMRLHALEWGVSTSEVENLRRLTPDVFRFKEDGEWKVEYDHDFPPNAANKQNLGYCLDLAINWLLRKKEHEQLRKRPQKERYANLPEIYVGRPIYLKADTKSRVIHEIQKDVEYNIDKKVSGFSDGEQFLYVTVVWKDNLLRGYLQVIDD